MQSTVRISARRRALIPLLLSLAMLAVAVFAVRSSAPLLVSGQRARGTVTALRLNSSGVRSVYDPLVRFRTTTGDIIEFEGEGSKTPDRRIGEVVEVLYAADKPTHAMIDRGVWNWLLPAAFGLCAVPVALLSMRALLRG
jgi:hypothetical protein